MAVSIGTRIGVYEVTGLLGAGGMGEVFRARDTRIGREVALKVLPADVTGNADRLRRFEQEARAAGTLNHPNLVTVHEFGMHEGAPYLVMELLDGDTLRSKLGETATGAAAARIPIRKSMEYAQQLASGLAAAHEKGIVHRDLKPDNVVITRDGRLKILDFGLAKLAASEDESAEASRTEARHTSPGTVLGTAGYMSPEQVRGLETDHRTDIFSFGAILYEMLSGKRAFRGDTSADTMSAILHEDPPELTSSTGQHVPPAVDRVIRRCLEKDKGERFVSARDLAFALDAVASSSTSHEQIAAATGARPLKTSLAMTLLIAAIAAAAAALVTWRATRGFAPATAPARPRAAFTQLTFDAGVESSPSIAPDGKTFVFVKGESPHRRIFLQRVDGRSAIALSSSEADDDHLPAFSPEGDQIAFVSARDGGGIFLMGATGESVRRLTSAGSDPAWSPDGSEIVFASEEIAEPTSRNSVSSLSVVNVSTGAVRQLFAGDAVQPAFSPNGKRIAYWALPPRGGQRDLYTIAANGDPKSIVPVTSDAALDWKPVWAPDGKSIYFGSDRGGTLNLWQIAMDQDTGRPAGEPQPVGLPTTRASGISISRDGRHLAYVARITTQELRRSTFDPATLRLTKDPQPILSGSMLARDIEPSADGQWIAFSTEARQEDIYVMRSDGTELRQLTNDPHRDRGVSWSADGSRIFFYSARSGEYDAWSIRPDGSGLTQVTKDRQVNFPRLSPDGMHLAWFDLKSGIVAPMSGDHAGKPEALGRPVGNVLFFPRAWSPDGTKLAGTGWIQRDRLFVYSPATRTYRTFESGGENMAWLDDHRILSFSSDGNAMIADVDAGKSRAVAQLEDVRAVSRTGRLVISGRNRQESDVWLMTTEGTPAAK